VHSVSSPQQFNVRRTVHCSRSDPAGGEQDCRGARHGCAPHQADLPCEARGTHIAATRSGPAGEGQRPHTEQRAGRRGSNAGLRRRRTSRDLNRIRRGVAGAVDGQNAELDGASGAQHDGEHRLRCVDVNDAVAVTVPVRVRTSRSSSSVPARHMPRRRTIGTAQCRRPRCCSLWPSAAR
jgi:hypothetical protein